MSGFAGSYDPGDVTFLLDRVRVEATSVAEKERLLQSGQRHYSEMIGQEAPPDDAYLALYRSAMDRNGERLARDVARLAQTLLVRRPHGVALLSLARAGTPIGVLLRRALVALGADVAHYSLSIIRDRGIDVHALAHVLERHAPERWIFVDGWTGKGAIARELARSVPPWAQTRGVRVPLDLAVVSDLAGVAEVSANYDDYLIPSSILNAVVSGLVSRTILPRGHAPGRFHQCIHYEELAPHDLSRAFVDALTPSVLAALGEGLVGVEGRDAARVRSRSFIQGCVERYGLPDEHRVKPGIGESTRAMLRRVPARVLLRVSGADDVQHLELLAARNGVPVDVDPRLPYRAAVLLRSVPADP